MSKIAFVGDPHIQFNNPICRQDNYFEAMIKKMKYIMKSNEVIIDLGDTFSNPVLDIQATMTVIDMLKTYKEKGGTYYCLIGNHSVYNWNINTISKTTLGLLAKLKLVTILDADLENVCKAISIEEYKIKPLSLNFSKKELPKAKGPHEILVGHAFYAYDKDKRHSLEYEDLKDLGFEYIFFGHDHQPYEPKIIEKTILYRPGSLGRTTSHTYNLERKVFYYQLDTEEKEVEKIVIPAGTRDEVFRYEVIEEKTHKTPEYVYDLESLMQSFRKKASSSVISIRKLLEDNPEVSNEIVEFIADAHEACGLEFV